MLIQAILVVLFIRFTTSDFLTDDLNWLEAEIFDLEKNLEGLESNIDLITRKAMTLREGIDKWEGSKCVYFSEFQCGFPQFQCIPHYLVCDDVADCIGGTDEEYCTIPFPKKSAWKGVSMPFYNCLKDPGVDPIAEFTNIHIDMTTSPYFPAIPWLNITFQVKLTTGLNWVWILDGYYSYANKMIVFWTWNWYGYCTGVYDEANTGKMELFIVNKRNVRSGDEPCGKYNVIEVVDS